MLAVLRFWFTKDLVGGSDFALPWGFYGFSMVIWKFRNTSKGNPANLITLRWGSFLGYVLMLEHEWCRLIDRNVVQLGSGG